MLRKTLPALWLAALALLGCSQASAQQAQRQHPEHTYGFRCAFDSAQQAEWARHPGAEQDYRAFLRSVAQMSSADQARILAQPDVTVPVVVHVIHNGTANNITDAQVVDAVRIINRDFNKENPDTATIDPRFVGIASRPGFRFRLAKIDPNGNCTTGITHTYSTQTLVGDNNVKNVIRWDVNRYLNIWVCENANGAGGYAILPCGGGSLYDGIVIRNAQFGSIGRSCGTNFCIRSLTHELGHYFGLPHTWGGSNTPGLATNCGIDDGIADTPNTIGSSGNCNLNEATCGPVANTENYMDYASCAKMFTEGQKTVMRASLALSCRSTLVSTANLVSTGTNDGYVAPACPPVAAFHLSTSTVCAGGSLQFFDDSYGNLGTVTYSWSFPGGTPTTSTQQNPTVTYSTPGVYDATLTITGTGGNSTTTQQQVVRVLGANAAEPSPYVQLFEDGEWLSNSTNPDRSWRNETSSPGSERFVRLSGVNGPSLGGSSALRLRLPNLNNGVITTLYSPVIDLTTNGGGNGFQLVFDRAYARRATTSTDQLRISFSADCGVTWSNPVTYNATLLVSNGGTLVTGNFTPMPTEWGTSTLNIPAAYQSASRLVVRLEVVANGGNNFYLDNFRVQLPQATRVQDMASHGIRVAPNPLTHETAVQFTLDKATKAQVQVLDVLGRPVLTLPAQSFQSGEQRIVLGTEGRKLAAGVYVVQLTLGDQHYTSRVLVQ